MRDQSSKSSSGKSRSGRPGAGDKLRGRDERDQPKSGPKSGPRGKTKSGRAKAEAGKGPTQRMLRIGEMIRHKIAELLVRGEIHDDVLAGHVVTVPEVRMSTDLKVATAYVMPLGGKDVEIVLAALERNKKFIRSEVAQTLDLRYAPDLRFRFDKTFDEVNRIDKLLFSDRVRADVEKE
jgi:ribosome-binding factor A